MTTPSLPPRVRAAERPILFSGAMVRALLAGTKTQTRRVVKAQPEAEHDGEPYWFVGGYRAWTYRSTSDVLRKGGNALLCPYGATGGRLWVRETFCDDWMTTDGIYYRADGGLPGDMVDAGCTWRPSIHMPRAASRITLEVTGVRVERLQDISEADAIAEGIEGFELPECGGRFWLDYRLTDAEAGCSPALKSPVDSYRWLWESINGPGSWDANPFVWVVEFRKLATEAAA